MRRFTGRASGEWRHYRTGWVINYIDFLYLVDELGLSVIEGGGLTGLTLLTGDRKRCAEPAEAGRPYDALLIVNC